jgi:peroxiredoxin
MVWSVAIVMVASLGALSLVHAANVPPTAELGKPAPDFSLQDQNGKTISLSDYKGKIVVLEWFNEECPYVQRHYRQQTMNKLADEYAPRGVIWLAINSTAGKTNESNKAAAKALGVDHPILNDSTGAVGHEYGAKSTPHMFIIDKTGNLVYSGAIDNDRDGDRTQGKVNYVSQALDEILAGKPVSEPRTRQYGCTVHYAR